MLKSCCLKVVVVRCLKTKDVRDQSGRRERGGNIEERGKGGNVARERKS
jgi:hypothetical protein